VADYSFDLNSGNYRRASLGIHKEKAKHAGVTEQEIAETIMIASLLRMGAAITHGAHCLD
jgi:alkylhydroperoxidase/carboxymuconolactone decarboxylase family protein YurZ